MSYVRPCFDIRHSPSSVGVVGRDASGLGFSFIRGMAPTLTESRLLAKRLRMLECLMLRVILTDGKLDEKVSFLHRQREGVHSFCNFRLSVDVECLGTLFSGVIRGMQYELRLGTSERCRGSNQSALGTWPSRYPP